MHNPLLAQAVTGAHSVLDPAGPQAGRITVLWWFLLAVALLVFVAFVAALLLGVWHGTRRSPAGPPDVAPAKAGERAATRGVSLAVAATAVILLGFTVASYLTGRAVGTLGGSSQPLTIRVTGNQWWWDVEYQDENPARTIRTANEIYIPVGRPVLLRLRSNDVIHSFWVPNLHGKRDLTPGYVSFTWVQADSAGVYRGQCAEFCGHQHAKMAFLVLAVSEDEFSRWYAAQLRPAAPPRDSLALAGRETFLRGTCAMCHRIRGTPAGALFGPDLTHVGSRKTIGAGTLPNTRANLAGWIADPQRVKPGAKMPTQSLSPAELRSLVHYLEGLR